LSASICRQCSEIFLPSLQCSQIGSRSALHIHGKEQWPDDEASNPGRDVLRDFQAALVGQFLNLSIIRLDFGSDHRTIGEL
jgi:hypothetical protein